MRFALYCSVLISILWWSQTSSGIRLELRYTQSFLYGVRDILSPVAVPTDVLIVTPYKSRKIGVVEKLSSLDRGLHIKALDNLRIAGVALVAIDFSFEERNDDHDNSLSRAIRSIPESVLVQKVREVHVKNNVIVPELISHSNDDTSDDVPARDSEVHKSVLINIVRNPVAPIADAASTLAPSLVSGSEEISDRIFLYRSILYNPDDHNCFAYPPDADLAGNRLESLGDYVVPVNVPTLPVVTYQYWRKSVTKETSETNKTLSKTTFSSPRCKSWDSEDIAELNNTINRNGNVADTQSGWRYLVEKRVGELLQGIVSDIENELRLNFYGPPRTIKTLDYDQLAEIVRNTSTDSMENILKDTIVFMGGSFVSKSDQQSDAYITQYSSNAIPMSGVEISATAFANMVNGNALRTLRPAVSSMFIIFAILMTAIASFKGSARFTLGMTFGMVIFVACLSSWMFIAWSVLLPVVLPLIGVCCVSFMASLFHLNDTEIARVAAEKNLRLFLSDLLISQLQTNKRYELANAICMVSDVRNFTTLGTLAPPDRLHEINDIYFTELFACVSKHGADVVKTYGDSMTAIWKINDANSYRSALKAGIDILSKNVKSDDGHEMAGITTNVGISAGTVAIGYVGSDHHRTVEISGTAVYLASRLEQLNKKLATEYLVSDTLSSYAESLKCTSQGYHFLKGFVQPVEVFSIGRIQPEPSKVKRQKSIIS